MAKEQITITLEDFDEAFDKAADFLAGNLADKDIPPQKAMFAMMIGAMVSAHIKHILFREETDDGN